MILETNEVTITDEQHDRAVRAVQVAGRFASIITRKELQVTMVRQSSIPAPAWSTSDSITFVESHIAGNLHTAEGVMSLKGLTCHEVCHILYTPRSGSNIAGWVHDNRLHRYFNMLEDMRIERLLVGRYGRSVVPWLTATVAQHLLSNASAVVGAFPLIHGRTYLPLELRVAVREAYREQSIVRELASVIDEYVRLVFPKDATRAQALIQRYADLLKQAGQNPDQPEGDGEGGCGSKSDSFDSTGRPSTQKEQERDQQKADRQRHETDDIPEPTDDQPVDGGDEGVEPNDDGDQQVDGDSDGDQPVDGGNEGDSTDGDQPSKTGKPGKSGESPTDADSNGETDGDGQKSDSDSSDSGSNGSGAGGASDDEPDLTDLLEDILDDIAEEFAESIHDTLVEIAGGAELEGDGGSAPEQAPFFEQEPSLDVRLASNAFGRELEDLQTAFDPGWERETPSGKLNVGRYLRGADLDESFDRWQAGRDDAVDIECVIVLDRSGSMNDRMATANQSTWAIKRALDKVGASTTVIVYGSKTNVLYNATDEATDKVRVVSAGGGTVALPAVQHATNVLASSDRKVKILLNITDGEWDSSSGDADELVATARRAGVLTALAFIADSDVQSVNAHESELTTTIRNTDDLFVLGRELVRVATARNLSVA